MPFTFRHAQLWARSSHNERGGQEESRRQVDIGNNQVVDNREVHDRKEEKTMAKNDKHTKENLKMPIEKLQGENWINPMYPKPVAACACCWK